MVEHTTTAGQCACCGTPYPVGAEVEFDRYHSGFVLTWHPKPPKPKPFRPRRYRTGRSRQRPTVSDPNTHHPKESP